MFEAIFKTFLKVIILTVLLIVTFALTFYMAFNQFVPRFARSPFASPFTSIWKTMTMAIGSLDYDNIFRQSTSDSMSTAPDVPFPAISYIMWVIFIILMPVLFTNLLVSLTACILIIADLGSGMCWHYHDVIPMMLICMIVLQAYVYIIMLGIMLI